MGVTKYEGGMPDLPFALACPQCGWRAKDPTVFRFVKEPMCPSCGGHLLRGTSYVQVPNGAGGVTVILNPRPTAWSRLLEDD